MFCQAGAGVDDDRVSRAQSNGSGIEVEVNLDPQNEVEVQSLGDVIAVKIAVLRAQPSERSRSRAKGRILPTIQRRPPAGG
jgi:hypothetical protein